MASRNIGARERVGLSQGELAEQASLERTVVNKIEAGVRKVSALELSDIAAALKVRMASFFREPTPALVAHRMRQDQDTVDARTTASSRTWPPTWSSSGRWSRRYWD